MRIRTIEMALDEMGALKKGRVIPSHEVYNPSLELGNVKTLIKVADTLGVKKLVEGAIETTIKDVQADLQNTTLSQAGVKSYYHDFYDEYAKSNLLHGSALLNRLYRLV